MGGILINTWTREKVESFVKRFIIYCLGLFLMALGVSFSVKSNLGVSPVSSLPYVTSLIINRDLGLVTTCVFTLYVFLQVCILRREFKIKSLLQILCASMFGMFVTVTNIICAFDAPTDYSIRLLLLLISIVLVAVGLLLYLTGNIIPQPAEGLIMTIASKRNLEIPKVKMIFDCTIVSISILMSFIFLGNLEGVREGTIIAAFGIGKVLGIVSEKYKDALVKFCEEKDPSISNLELD
ncbi:YczE/YyaS/YitT family protein [Wukongibacter sp. M2B1]|uniref:YczE/YyaS/YitT family protein n=1 Tax=Wukongibacter sp. M2B1 TaxID=3088895 RepID=UPI003D79C011